MQKQKKNHILNLEEMLNQMEETKEDEEAAVDQDHVLNLVPDLLAGTEIQEGTEAEAEVVTDIDKGVEAEVVIDIAEREVTHDHVQEAEIDTEEDIDSVFNEICTCTEVLYYTLTTLHVYRMLELVWKELPKHSSFL
mmetsp:Transcript_14495/g.20206  ORF Transcript_14495/g.20206 Transcript_14495/m.20206 type:complete len:137 (-) Transcript_14495:495-905(-)